MKERQALVRLATTWWSKGPEEGHLLVEGVLDCRSDEIHELVMDSVLVGPVGVAFGSGHCSMTEASELQCLSARMVANSIIRSGLALGEVGPVT